MLYKNIYLANATVLLCHQIEAAYWHEWNLFALPGGIQLFVLLNIPIVLVILWGFGAVIRNSASGTIYSWVLVVGGLFAAFFHSYHLWRGDQTFTLPISISLLIATLVLSVLQAGILLNMGKKGDSKNT